MSTKKSGTSKAIEIVGKLQPMILIPGAKLSRTGMILDANLITWEMAEKIAEFLGGLAQANQWWLGDFLTFSEAKWGDKYAQLAALTGYEEGSLMQMCWVAGKVQICTRVQISFFHHRVVAKLDMALQEKWLKIAMHEKLSVKELNASVKAGEVVRMTPGADDEKQARGGINTIQGWSSLAIKWIHETIERQPIERWSDGRKDEIRAMLDPIVEFHGKLAPEAPTHDAEPVYSQQDAAVEAQ